MTSRPGLSRKLIVFLLVVVGLGLFVTRRVYPADQCGEVGASKCPTPEHEAAAGTFVERADFCADAGYLCRGGLLSSQVRRWSLFKGAIHVRIPLPEDYPSDVAHRIRSAAIEGILQWDGHPFRIDIDSGSLPTRRWDVTLLWTRSLAGISGNTEGVTHFEPAMTPNAADFAIRNIAVISNPSGGTNEAIALAYVSTIAAHEMGHALGLGHSDAATDVMYFAAAEGTHVTERDIATVDWLYWLPAGASVR